VPHSEVLRLRSSLTRARTDLETKQSEVHNLSNKVISLERILARSCPRDALTACEEDR
jgi:uncharacterized protein YlxW (UPF0749 family)